jgi:hypothetical protein
MFNVNWICAEKQLHLEYFFFVKIVLQITWAYTVAQAAASTYIRRMCAILTGRICLMGPEIGIFCREMIAHAHEQSYELHNNERVVTSWNCIGWTALLTVIQKNGCIVFPDCQFMADSQVYILGHAFWN